MKSPRSVSATLLIFLLLSVSFAGCTGVLAPVSPTARLEVDVDNIHIGEAVNFDARASTTPDPTIITSYLWDFGVAQRNSSNGYVSQVFNEAGRFDVQLTVVNDLGGEDSISVSIYVNALPIAAISGPTSVKTGSLVTLDASSSSDPEGGVLLFEWDSDWSKDSDGDGNFQNDVDETNSTLTLLPNSSGDKRGSVTVIDDKGAMATTTWEIRVIERTFNVTWQQQKMTFSDNGYLEQGESHVISHFPADGFRIFGFNGTLTLARDINPAQWPEDNFTMVVSIPESNWNAKVETKQDSPTSNSTGSIERENLNPYSEKPTTYTADSPEALMETLLSEPGARFGQGEWLWTLTVDQADPDFLDQVDPDPGNEWELEVEFTILVPIILEVGML
jgi:PKD repeat protein